MKVYKRSLWVMVKGLLMAPCAAAIACFFLSMFVENALVLMGVPALIFLALIYMAIFSENIRFELEDNGTLRYFQKGKLKKTYKLEEYLFGYHKKSDSMTSDITMNIMHVESGAEESVDCSPLGASRFASMYEEIKLYMAGEPEVLRA